MRPIQRILVPLDGSPLAETILPHVVDLSRRYDAEVVLLRVVLAHAFPGSDLTDAQVHLVGVAVAYLAEVERHLQSQGMRVDTAVRYGHPPEQILDHAQARHVDLIAMSTHGRTGLAHAVLGSVAEHVVRRSPVPVLLLPPTAAGVHRTAITRDGAEPKAA